ncbi:hypothetical protein K9N68_39025 (plasmid) [Kovacikia minuta CCNUW1]|uniref:hypothetical protein n=1 Tax=Kovacikia minuta TaxID=2931930 RepID=UPI001CCEB7CA|nr:hypothetical protein [Kovacikia minuta]UBF30139.1 hypothetical protein K9N68_39025 [Kovacikia minuta CCNUW1]
MLQKIYWLGQIQNEQIHTTQEFRTLFCKHEFPHPTFISPAFAMVGGGLISNTHAWTLVINNCSIMIGAGSAYTSVDDVSEQIRRLLILRMNLLFAQSPEEIERYCNTSQSVGSNVVPRKILPNVFSDTPRLLHKEVEILDAWFQKVLSLPRQKYCAICQALAAYERALHVLSSDPALSYSLLVFVIEALANNHVAHQATWDDVRGEPRKRFDALFEDDRISSVDISWIEDLRKALVDVVHPGSTRRFANFALKHIPDDLYDASNSTSKSPIRHSRIHQSIQNAYVLRSSFSHALEPLTQFLISESYRAEEIEKEGETYLTLRGLFRLVRSIILEFIEQQETVGLHSHPWIIEVSHGVVSLPRVPAYTRMKNRDGQINSIESQYAQYWFEDILQIYQDNYIEHLHKQISDNQDDGDRFMGVATSGSWAGRFLFRFDPDPSYDWKSLKEQALRLIAQAKKSEKAYLQAIALLCTHLTVMDGEEAEWKDVMAIRTFGNPILGLERFVVDVIHNKTSHWSSKQAEDIFEKHLKNKKVLLPTRVEVACMLELAKLFKSEGFEEGRKKWLDAAYGDAALYPNLQNLIRRALDSSDTVVEPQDALNVSNVASKELDSEKK